MEKRISTRGELLERWRGIQQLEDEEDDATDIDSSSKRRHAFNFLICLPKENHIWCGFWDLMGPLLETFYNYFKDERQDSPLKLLWKRISGELRLCSQCICQYHQAQEMYYMEYDQSSIRPLLDTLQKLDEERVVQHLKEINTRVMLGKYEPALDNNEVVGVMFEVLMFPVLLDDQVLAMEFQTFIEAIDNSHELTLAGNQQYPGVYALLFLKSRRTRSIGLRLAGCMGKLRRAEDLELLQPLLKKYIGLLGKEGLPSTSENQRPRMQPERMTIWLGLKALLGFLEPAAFEEGVLERYPILLSIVLNHISDDTDEFSHAVNCLRLIFEMLGCKLWLGTTLSPSMMRNSLLGQCFHTRNEKTLQDGEHEKQRRHLLYFLLHQVPVSSNFSILMRKKACQIALQIVLRGYKMDPPCAPFECAHMGPSLVSSLKDFSLHNSLRQPAFDLIQTIIVSDAAALITSVLKYQTRPSTQGSSFDEFDEGEDRVSFAVDDEEKDSNIWKEFSLQGQITSRECKGWMCIPMLWFDVLIEIDPSVLPISFSKAVFWALSRFSMVEPGNSTELVLPVRNWLASCAKDVSVLFGWKVPTGSDDGGNGTESKNSIDVSLMCIPLVRTFKRFAAHYVALMEQSELKKQWTWEPRMAESLILLLVDPNDSVRQVDRLILEQVSGTRGLASGLQFLCSCGSSLSAMFLGLRHALGLVQLESVLSNFQTLHHFFFVLSKLLKEGISCNQILHGNPWDDGTNFSSQGGFLWQPVFDSVYRKASEASFSVDVRYLEAFCFLVSKTAWPAIKKCLLEGKAFVDHKISQMTCVRVLEILPIVFQRLLPSPCRPSDSSELMVSPLVDLRWLFDLMDWGKSSLPVVVRYWKQTVASLLALLKDSCSMHSESKIKVVEKLILSENVSMDELMEQVSRLSISLLKDDAFKIMKTDSKAESAISKFLSPLASDAKASTLEDPNVQLLDSTIVDVGKDTADNIVVLSDDEAEQKGSMSSPHTLKLDDMTVAPASPKKVFLGGLVEEESSKVIVSENMIMSFQQKDSSYDSGPATRKEKPYTEKSKVPPSSLKIKGTDKDIECHVDDSEVPKLITNLKKSTEIVNAKSSTLSSSMTVSEARRIIKELVDDAGDDPLECALEKARHNQLSLKKLSSSVPKRQVIQLNLPGENRSSYLHKLEANIKRFKPPKLDDWYRPILELDFFSVVGLASTSENQSQTIGQLREVPICFDSHDQYVDIFRPLVLEEFKAQLQSSYLEMSSLEEMCCGSLSVLSVERIDDFHLVRCVHDINDSPTSKSCSENDLVLFTKQPPHSSSHEVHMVGKVERCEKDNKRRSNIIVIRLYFQAGSARLNRARKLLLERSRWYVTRVMSLTPQLREFQALSALKDIPLVPIILRPTSLPSMQNESRKVDLRKLSQPFQDILKSSFNESQLQAITVAISSDSKKEFDMSLIQGPPGTGKTRTIVAIVSALFASPMKRITATKGPSKGNSEPNNTAGFNSRSKISQSVAIARAWQDAALARQLNRDAEKGMVSMERSARGRVLICAQSNAAVDELVSRISVEGLCGSHGKMYKPYLVRVGNAKTVHPNSLPFFIDTLVDHRLAEEKMTSEDGNTSSGDSSMTLRSDLEKLVDRIRFYEAKRASLRDGNSGLKDSIGDEILKEEDDKEMSDAEIGAKLRKLYEQKKQAYENLAAAQAREKKANEERRALRHKLRRSILKEAEIVVTTLSGCGGGLYEVCSESVSSNKFCGSSENTLFDAVVIDEAAQALEPATLIPLQLLKSNKTKCIMVGDPKQLPATVLSSVASKYLYQCSMFERLQRAGYPVTMLTQQYRMHPEICRFPSLHFYDGKLLNGENMSSKSAPFHETQGLGPYVFFDVVDGVERQGKSSGAMSLYNDCEADAAVELLKGFKRRYPSEFVGGRIGIITPYKCQLSFLRSRFSNAFGSSITADMEFNTVDGFQGREVDILVLSTVRASDTSSGSGGKNSTSIGFVADIRRMNVALTRAKLSLWILGNARTLRKNENWAALVKDAEKRNLVISVRRPYDSVLKATFTKHNRLENSGSNSRLSMKNENIMSSCNDAKMNSKERSGKKSKYIGSEGLTKGPKDGDVPHVSETSEDTQSDRRRGRHENEISGKKLAKGSQSSKSLSEIPETGEYPVHFKQGRVGDERSFPEKPNDRKGHRRYSDCKGSSVLGEEVMNCRSKGKEFNQKQPDLENSLHKVTSENRRTNSDRSDHAMHDNSKGSKSQILKEPTASSERQWGQKNVVVSNPSSEGSHKDSNDSGRAPKSVLLAQRKQQRDAVDALLSSSLISSKKPEAALGSLPVKRPLSSTSVTPDGIKPPKARKGMGSASQERIGQDHGKRDKSSTSRGKG
ncbi:DNA2/NAM7 helicase-like, C-terminal [Dillenia turbinata]|uniref:DNA2/NAM7 helicase-like, C-terminal n=1 Tax=Dillenia turbinata TaxID=194707 RepID=A0AAN8UII0_9MAGN